MKSGKSFFKAPEALRIPKISKVHNDQRIDNYHWMKNLKSPEFINYVKEENEYTDYVMSDTKDLQEKLFREIVSRIRETDVSVPVSYEGNFYYTRTEKDKQYPIYCRKEGSLQSDERILLDLNQISLNKAYCDLGAYEPSPNQEMLMYSVDNDGSETYLINIIDIKKDKLLIDRIENTTGDCLWANDNKTVFYTVFDKTKRPYRLYRHILGRKKDTLLYEEKNRAFSIWISKTRSNRFVLVNIRSNTTCEIHTLDADSPSLPMNIVAPRRHKIECYLEHHENSFFIKTNENAENFKVMELSLDDISRKKWREVIPHRKDVMIEDLDAFKEHLVVYEREKGLKKIRVINLKTNKEHYVEFPEKAYNFWTEGNWVFNADILRFSYESPVTPRTVYDYDLNGRTKALRKKYDVFNYDSSLYEVSRIHARSTNGAEIPITLVHKKGMKRNGKNPLYMIGYGAYGICYEPSFSSSRISLLDRNFIFAIAHIRGGKELGRSWYKNGKLLKKKNTFRDFIACTEHLIAEKYTSAELLTVNGRSAGGLLMGAIANMRPDLFRSIISYVPFVDALNTMLDPSLPLTVGEYEEWGNPLKLNYYRYIKSYSPYDNIKPQNYPNILVIGSLNDSRVMCWEPVKWAAKLREMKTDKNILLLKINVEAGHSGSSGRYDFLKEIAFEFSFVFKIMGIKL